MFPANLPNCHPRADLGGCEDTKIKASPPVGQLFRHAPFVCHYKAPRPLRIQCPSRFAIIYHSPRTRCCSSCHPCSLSHFFHWFPLRATSQDRMSLYLTLTFLFSHNNRHPRTLWICGPRRRIRGPRPLKPVIV